MDNNDIIEVLSESNNAYFTLSTLLNIFSNRNSNITATRVIGFLSHKRLLRKKGNMFVITEYGKQMGYFREIEGDTRIYLSSLGLVKMIEAILNDEVWTD